MSYTKKIIHFHFFTWKIIPTAINDAIIVNPLAAVVNPTKNFAVIFWGLPKECYEVVRERKSKSATSNDLFRRQGRFI